MARMFRAFSRSGAQADHELSAADETDQKRDKSSVFDFVLFAASVTMPPPVQFYDVHSDFTENGNAPTET